MNWRILNFSLAASIMLIPVLQAEEKNSGQAIADKLLLSITLEKGIEANTPLKDALEYLGDRYDLTFLINLEAFKEDLSRMDMKDQPVKLPKLTEVRLSTVLRMLLAQVDGTYVIRTDHVEITTLKRAGVGTFPVIYADFDKRPLEEALQKLAKRSDLTILLDQGRVGDKGRTPVTANLKNVPLDTAVRLLADMAELKMVLIGTVIYVTTEENAEKLNAEEEKRSLDTAQQNRATFEHERRAISGRGRAWKCVARTAGAARHAGQDAE